ncbi:MAG: DNA mismatch repair endonuclease MutL [Salibacteraceae bacterium]
MGDFIKLLPDSVANQIAAGEVVQRPASVVKELVENAIDAGADHIQLIIKESGRTLIQVIDNGKGMSPTDARLSLERHATSKIQSADDLFHIKTMGFRGEALASIVAVAQCELKTKTEKDEIGTSIIIEGSDIKSQEPCACERGTSISVKNLFYNIPARRKFLKSNAVENRHIIDQFERIAIIYPDIHFTFHQDNVKLFHLESGSLRQRIVAIFGKKYDDRLVPLQEETNMVNLSGFICKPEFAKKKKDGQFLFVNNRFIKSNYLHHGILAAYDELLPRGMHPSYFLHLECDPESIDVNIHPTKTEIKFEEERSIYAILRSTVKKALGEHNISPTLDFNRETAFDDILPNQPIVEPKIPVDKNFNPFTSNTSTQFKSKNSGSQYTKPITQGWETLVSTPEIKPQQNISFEPINEEEDAAGNHETTTLAPQKHFFQIQGKYIFTPIKSGAMIIDVRRAHERILYERNLRALAMNQGISQKSLFPVNIDLKASDSALLNELMPQLHLLGFEIEEFGNNSFIVRGLPAELSNYNCNELIDELLFNFKENEQNLELKTHMNLAYSLAYKDSIGRSRILENEECATLIEQLFTCENHQTTVTGKPIVSRITIEELQKKFD